MVVLDTNIIIDHLRQPKTRESHLVRIAKEKAKEALTISMVSIQELYEGKSTRDEEREQSLLATIAPLKILPYTYEIARIAGEIARDVDYPIELADAAIAATAIVSGAQLLTLDKRDFRGVKGLEFVSLRS